MVNNSARKVAIVEDDFDQRENYRDALQQSGYEVTTYANRPEALKGMHENMPDLAILEGLRLDAWDYLTKPLNMQFLSVRINSLFRIVDSLNQTPDQAQTDTLVIDQLSINEDSMSIKWQDQELSLTLTEFWLIESMARHPGHVKTYENMMQITRQSYVERNTINGYIRRIRNKFKEIDPDFKQIQTVFGVGYKWNSDG